MVTLRRVFALGFALSAALACERPKEQPAVRAQFGIFYGGDVQDREELPLVLDRTRQTHGLRIEFREPPARPERVAWEIQKPGPAKGADAGSVVEYGEVRTRPGETRLDVPLAFRATDKPGTWRVRLTVGDDVVLERAFRVIPPGPDPLPPEE